MGDGSVSQKRLLSIIVPVYNEEEYVAASILRALNAPLPEGIESEIVAVYDGSTYGSPGILKELAAAHPGRIRIFHHEVNSGKGAAIRTGLQQAAGEFGIIQDSDLEYDPAEYPKVLAPLVANRADVVYGSRFLISGERRVIYFWHSRPVHLRFARQSAGPLSQLFRAAVARPHGEGRISGGADTPLQPRDPPWMAAERPTAAAADLRPHATPHFRCLVPLWRRIDRLLTWPAVSITAGGAGRAARLGGLSHIAAHRADEVPQACVRTAPGLASVRWSAFPSLWIAAFAKTKVINARA